MKESAYAQRAMELFLQGYNCSQSVFLAFEDMYDMNQRQALRLSSSFGGGMGRLREVCGAVSGMFLAAGILYGYDSPDDKEAKAAHYKRIQQLAAKFEAQNGSIVCRDLLGLAQGGKDHYVPEERTKEYYRKRPCKELVGMAAAIMGRYIDENAPD